MVTPPRFSIVPHGRVPHWPSIYVAVSQFHGCMLPWTTNLFLNTFPPFHDQGGMDLLVNTWAVATLDGDVVRAGRSYSYHLRVDLYLVGNQTTLYELPSCEDERPLCEDQRYHFNVWWFISLDDRLLIDPSDVVLGINISDTHKKELKVYPRVKSGILTTVFILRVDADKMSYNDIAGKSRKRQTFTDSNWA